MTNQQDGQWPGRTVVHGTFPLPKTLNSGTFPDMYYGPEVEQRAAGNRQETTGSPSRGQYGPDGYDRPDGILTLKKPPPPAADLSREIEGEGAPENPSVSAPRGPAQGVRHLVPDGEIRLIADRVYRMLEKRIAIEKERRGLR